MRANELVAISLDEDAVFWKVKDMQPDGSMIIHLPSGETLHVERDEVYSLSQLHIIMAVRARTTDRNVPS